MAFGSCNLNILGHYWWQLCQMFQNSLILLKLLISWARGGLTAKMMFVQCRHRGFWLLLFCVCVFLILYPPPFFLGGWAVTAGSSGLSLYLRDQALCHQCRPDAPSSHGVRACLTDAQGAATPHPPAQTAQPGACPVGPSILKSMKALNKTSGTKLLLWQMHPPGRVSSDMSGEKEKGIWQLLICLLFWQPRLAWSHCPQDQSPHCTWPLPHNCCPPPSSLLASYCDCSPVHTFNTGQAHTLSKTAPWGPVGSPDSGPACLPKRKKGSWVLV